MDASKLINGSRDEVLAKRSAPEPKSVQASAARSNAKKVDKKSTRKKAKTERPQVKAVRKSKSEKLVCRYCGSGRLVTQLHQATRSPLPQMFQQALWIGGSDQEDDGQEIGLLKSMTGPGRKEARP